METVTWNISSREWSSAMAASECSASAHRLMKTRTQSCIVEITSEEAHYLDFDLKPETVMPSGWRFGVDDPFARIKTAQIEVVPAEPRMNPVSHGWGLQNFRLPLGERTIVG